LTIAAINNQELIKNISQFEFIKPSTALFFALAKKNSIKNVFDAG
jgi:hypothetical protein